MWKIGATTQESSIIECIPFFSLSGVIACPWTDAMYNPALKCLTFVLEIVLYLTYGLTVNQSRISFR